MNITKNDDSLTPNEEKIKYLTDRVAFYERNFEQLFNYSDSIIYNPMKNIYYVYPVNDSNLCIEVFPQDIELYKIVKEEYLRRRTK